MSGPKSSRYTLTAAQRRILEEQRRSGRRKKNLTCSGKKIEQAARSNNSELETYLHSGTAAAENGSTDDMSVLVLH